MIHAPLSFVSLAKAKHLSTEFGQEAQKAYSAAGEEAVVELIRASLIRDADIEPTTRAYTAPLRIDIEFIRPPFKGARPTMGDSVLQAIRLYKPYLEDCVESNKPLGKFNHQLMAECLANLYEERLTKNKASAVASRNIVFMRGSVGEELASRVLAEYYGIDHLTKEIPDSYLHHQTTYLSMRWDQYHEFRNLMALFGFSSPAVLASRALLHMKNAPIPKKLKISDLKSPFDILKILPPLKVT